MAFAFFATAMDYLFQSSRLGFRQWHPSDLSPFAALNADADVMEFFPNTLTVEQTQVAIKRYQRHFVEQGYGWYATDLLKDGKFIGFIGLSKVSLDVNFSPCTEIGWRLAKAYWGHGLATEGAKACLDYAWNTLQLKEVYSLTPLLNKPSTRVMQKIGMTYQNSFLHPKIEKGHRLEDHVLYKVKNPTRT